MSTERPSLKYRLEKAISNPRRIIPYFKKVFHNARIKMQGVDDIDFYAKVVDDYAVKDPCAAIGSQTKEHWLQVGQMQFDYMIEHGLKPEHKVLDIGCGNMRAGWRLANFLNAGNYTGIDISPKILLSAADTIAEFGLQAKLPYVFLVKDASLSFLPNDHYDRANAHSVFSHMPLEVIKTMLKSVARVLKEGGTFDFTFFETESSVKSFCDEDFYYPRELLVEVVKECGLRPEYMEDWKYIQNKIRCHRD